MVNPYLARFLTSPAAIECFSHPNFASVRNLRKLKKELIESYCVLDRIDKLVARIQQDRAEARQAELEVGTTPKAPSFTGRNSAEQGHTEGPSKSEGADRADGNTGLRALV